MTSTLLVLLASDLLAPFPAEFRAVVVDACAGTTLEVAVGEQAPPGRNVAWVTPTGPHELELVLHTSRIAGDLRRVLRFAPTDAPRERARAAAFTLASMIRERDADLNPLQPPTPAAPAASAPVWLLDASLGAGLGLPGASPGLSLSVDGRRALLPWLLAGVGAQLLVASTPGTTLVQPSLWGEAGLVVEAGAWRPAMLLGGGVLASSFVRNGMSLTAVQPFLRVGVEAGFRLDDKNGVRGALRAHLAPDSVALFDGSAALGVAGPAWVQVEVGYTRSW
ncbi:MAG: hypothetical protein ACOZQL_33010 [Myxococcota bacterium]